MRLVGICGVVAALLAAAGCSRETVVACTPDTRYATARSAQPVQIPDDLTPPNESDALRLPPDVSGATAAEGECLDSPPAFFGDSRPFLRGDAAEESAPEPPPPNDSPAAGGDRVIDN